ncbi:unnamed protein product [Calypogeia fissa]
MAGGQVRKVWEKILSRFKQVNQRQLQHEIDTHRLFLLTSFNKLGASGGEEIAEEIQCIADSTPFSAQQVEVQNNVHKQIAAVADILDSVLLKTPRKSDVQSKKWQSGLGFAVGGITPQPRLEAVETHPLSKFEVSEILQERLGFTLECKPSRIQHEEAGEGLFLRGRAEPGAVISMYPGVIYTPSQYRFMPGYPRVDRGNPYLISRYDGLIVDAKPWGKGGESRDWWNGSDSYDSKALQQQDDSLAETNVTERSANHSYSTKGREGLWESVAGPEQRGYIPIKSAILERRNPLALGHFANHPPKDTKPNVMICPYSISEVNEVIRPYVPNLVLAAEEEQMERLGLLWTREGRDFEDYSNKVSKSEIRTLVLVATRTLVDEEVLLNYRLSSHITTPTWFHSVDEEEDQRRWA